MKHLIAILVSVCFFSIGAQGVLAISWDFDRLDSSVYTKKDFSTPIPRASLDNTGAYSFEGQKHSPKFLFLSESLRDLSYPSVRNRNFITLGSTVDFFNKPSRIDKGDHDNRYLFAYSPSHQFSRPVVWGELEVVRPELSHSTTDSVAPVPEPATLILLGTGLLGLGGASRKLKQKKKGC